jgi:hypothetical protein
MRKPPKDCERLKSFSIIQCPRAAEMWLWPYDSLTLDIIAFGPYSRWRFERGLGVATSAVSVGETRQIVNRQQDYVCTEPCLSRAAGVLLLDAAL